MRNNVSEPDPRVEARVVVMCALSLTHTHTHIHIHTLTRSRAVSAWLCIHHDTCLGPHCVRRTALTDQLLCTDTHTQAHTYTHARLQSSGFTSHFTAAQRLMLHWRILLHYLSACCASAFVVGGNERERESVCACVCVCVCTCPGAPYAPGPGMSVSMCTASPSTVSS